LFERKEFIVRVDATQSKNDVFADIVEQLRLPAADSPSH
jgi:hypothetical protein